MVLNKYTSYRGLTYSYIHYTLFGLVCLCETYKYSLQLVTMFLTSAKNKSMSYSSNHCITLELILRSYLLLNI